MRYACVIITGFGVALILGYVLFISICERLRARVVSLSGFIYQFKQFNQMQRLLEVVSN
jgi:hypothetical protein